MKTGRFIGLFMVFVSAAAPASLRAAAMLYWSEATSGSIKRANLDGTGVQTIFSAAPDIREIAIDPVAGKVYWGQGTSIRQTNLDGSNVQTVVAGLSSCWGVEVDEVGRKLYFTDSVNDRIGRANLDGSSVEYLVTTGQRNPIGLDIDPVNGKMYWAVADGSGTTPNDAIRRANTTVGPVVENIIPNQMFPLDVVLNVAAGKLYFTDQFAGTVKSANLDGTGLTTLASAQGNVFPIDLFDGTLYYASLSTGTIKKVPAAGGVPTTIITGLSEPRGLAILVPEPAGVTLLAAWSLLLARRRRATE